MGRRATNVLAFNDQAIRKAVKEAMGKPRGEWRVAGVDRLVLMTQPTGTGTFFVFYTGVGGKRQKLRLGEYHPERFTLREARARALDAMAAINRGVDPVAEADARANAMTFQALAQKFLNENPDLAATTRHVYRYCLQKDVYPMIGDMPASDVTADHVVKICKTIEASGARVQSERTKTTIGGVYRWGMRQRLVKANPCSGIGRRSPKVARARTPTDDELAVLWSAIEGQSGKLSLAMRLIIQLAIVTGQRRTEVAGARLSELHDLDTDNAVWVIPGDVNKRGKIIEGRTKNGREQRVPLSTQAAALFRKAIALSDSNEFVFPADLARVKIGKDPRAPHIHGESVTMAMRRLRERPILDAENNLKAAKRALKIAGKAIDTTAVGQASEELEASKKRVKEAKPLVDDISIHDMRRAISNWLKDQGISREVRDLILNHKDPSVTEAHYSNSARMLTQVRNALQAWANHVSQITGQAAAQENVVAMSLRA
jgi:integrase